MTKSTKSTQDAADRMADRIESRTINWVRNDTHFNWLRGTTARVVLACLIWIALYGLGAWSLFHAQAVVPYIICLLALGLAQKVSVRFVFDDDSIIDEYQLQRRNSAYRRAYKRVTSVVATLALLVLVVIYYGSITSGNFSWWPLPVAHLNVDVQTYQVVVLATFGLGLFGLQKYISWGFRGEAK